MTTNDAIKNTCSDLYNPDGSFNFTVSWTWFPCLKTEKCIHIDSRCDGHPHFDCIYEKDGLMVAEDEENCFDEYKRKGYIAESALFVCDSPIHNSTSPPVYADYVWNWSDNTLSFNVTVIPGGTIVQIETTRCDGVLECGNGGDEDNCGSPTFFTFPIGK